MRLKAVALMSRSFVSLLFILSTVLYAGCSTTLTRPTVQSGEKITLEKLWARDTLGRNYLETFSRDDITPVVVGDLVLQGNGINALEAFEKKSGSPVWRLDIPGGVGAAGTQAGGSYFVGTNYGEVLSIEPLSGKVVWRHNLGAPLVSEITFENHRLYVLDSRNRVHALDSKNGQPIWSFEQKHLSPISIRGGSRPVFHDDVIYVGFSSGHLTALNSEDGSLRWERHLSAEGRFRDIDATPLVTPQGLFVSAYDGAVYKMNLESGQVEWKVEQAGGHVPLVLHQGRIYAATSQRELLVIDAASGKVLKKQPLKSLATSPVIYQNHLIFGEAQGQLRVVELESLKPKAGYATGWGIASRPVIDLETQTLFVFSNASQLYALKLRPDASSGKPPWSSHLFSH